MKWFGPIFAAAICAASPSTAQDAFGERVRAYLLANPEVIVEALSILAERELRAGAAVRIAAFPELFAEAPALGVGAPDAPIRVVEFFDYRCAPCKALHPHLETLVEAHPELRIEMRHLPILSPGSERAARFALATQAVAGAEAHARVNERLWQLRGPLRHEDFARIAEEEALDFSAIEAAMQGDSVAARISYNRDVAIALEVIGTPAFVTPETVTVGVTDLETLAGIWLSL